MEIKTIFLIIIAVIVLTLVVWGLLVQGIGIGEENPAVKIILDWIQKLFSPH